MWNWKPAKAVLEALWDSGRLVIAGRRNFQRVYDLPERVLPAAILAAPDPTPAASARWFALLKLRQRRLAALKRDELRHVGDEVDQPRRELGQDGPGGSHPLDVGRSRDNRVQNGRVLGANRGHHLAMEALAAVDHREERQDLGTTTDHLTELPERARR